MEYMIMNEDNAESLMFLILVEKGYYHPLAFRCLERIKQDFLKFFDSPAIRNAKYLGLSKEFEGAFDRIYVNGGVIRTNTRRTHWTRQALLYRP